MDFSKTKPSQHFTDETWIPADKKEWEIELPSTKITQRPARSSGSVLANPLSFNPLSHAEREAIRMGATLDEIKFARVIAAELFSEGRVNRDYNRDPKKNKRVHLDKPIGEILDSLLKGLGGKKK